MYISIYEHREMCGETYIALLKYTRIFMLGFCVSTEVNTPVYWCLFLWGRRLLLAFLCTVVLFGLLFVLPS